MNLQGVILRKISHRKTNTIRFHLYMDSKKQNKWTNIRKQKETHRYREQTGGCQSGEVWGDEWTRWGRLRGTNSSYNINESCGWNVQHEEIVNNIIITFMGLWSLKTTLNFCYRDHFVMCGNTESLCYAHRIYIVL